MKPSNLAAQHDSGVESQFNTNRQVPGTFYIDPAIITNYVDGAVQNLVNETFELLLQDEAWLNKIQTHIASVVISRLSDKLALIDIDFIINQHLDAALERYRERINKSLNQHGVLDSATAPELIISDGAVIAKSGLGCQELLVEKSTTSKFLQVQDLCVMGTINTDGHAWQALSETIADKTQNKLGEQWKQQLVSQVLDLAKQSGIDFKDISINGAALVEGNRLNPSITESAIQKVGTLQELKVKGSTNLGNIMHVDHRRVGINTDAPDMALTLWDEEVSLSLGKVSKDKAWIGSNRSQSIDIGVNRRKAITIDKDCMVSIDKLRVDRWQISFGNEIPSYAGTRGDIVFNHDPKPGSAWAWQCLGAFKWQPIGSK